MSDILKRLKCRSGYHDWSGWSKGDYQASRFCKRCSQAVVHITDSGIRISQWDIEAIADSVVNKIREEGSK